MARKFLGGAGHVSNVFGAGQAVWAGAGALWAGLVIVSTWAFTTVSAVMDQGWGAVFLAGLAAASAAAVALAVLLFGIAALAHAIRRIWRSPPSAPDLRSNPGEGHAEVETDRHGSLEKRVADLEAQFGQVFGELQPAIAGLSELQRSSAENLSASIAGLRQAVAEAAGRHDAAAAEWRKAIADAEAFAKQYTDGRIVNLEHALEQFRLRLDALDGQMGVFQRGVYKLLRARDAERMMQKAAAEVAARSARLSRADPREYSDAAAWRAEYENWALYIGDFWRALSDWTEGVPDPLDVQDERDLDAVSPPESPLLSSFENQQRYRRFAVANERFARMKDTALKFVSAQGNPPL